MCGRYTFRFDELVAKDAFKAQTIRHAFKQNYNAAPTQQVPVVYENNNEIELDTFRWGFIPKWAKNKSYVLINTRAETIAEKPSFRNSFIHKRCLILADGFYEWKRLGKERIPYYIFLKNRKLFGFAGIYDNASIDGKEIKTCSIITVKSNKLVSELHDRMPVILPKHSEETWLNTENVNQLQLQHYLQPYKSNDMIMHKVDSKVNSVKNNTPDCAEPLGS